jgi:hypothetical protein
LKLNALEPFASRRIIPSMRRLILAVMIVLLPLRGWIGDAMALEAATGTPVAIQNIAIDDHPTLEITHFEADSGRQDLQAGPGHCPDHASAPAGEDDSDTSADGQACTVCQVCHTVAMSADAAPLPALPLPALVPEMPFPRFTSALPAPGLKPPIS